MDMPLPSYPHVVRALCQAIVTDTTQRVAGPRTGYRCKATYSLYPPPLKVSDLATGQVNALCLAVEEFAAERTRTGVCFYTDHPKFLLEVCGKVTRRDECMVKVVFGNDLEAEGPDKAANKETLFATWYDQTEEPQLLFAFLKARFPRLVCVVAHVRLAGPRLSLKPDKTCAYLPICATKAGRQAAPMQVTELTPNNFSFVLSADSFCEVNQLMEDAIFRVIVEFLSLEPRGTTPARRAFISGRDVNSVVKTFEPYYESVIVTTTCPNVYADTKLNEIEGVHLVKKDAIGQLLWDTFAPPTPTLYESSHVLITAGRHGLHPSTTTALSQLAEMRSVCHGGVGLTDIIYVSCNVESFARDLFVLKQGLRVSHVRTFDFFPGTEYVMTVVHLQPMNQHDSGLLLMPVGPPGAGKSTCARALRSFFATPMCSDGSGDGDTVGKEAIQTQGGKPGRARSGKAATGPLHNSSSLGKATAVVPRTFAQMDSNVRVVVLERDLVFHQLREAGATLRKAKVAAHERLLTTLARPPREVAGGEPSEHCAGGHPRSLAFDARTRSAVTRNLVYLDSTNGSLQARTSYRELWAASSPAVTLWFACPPLDSGLLARVSLRAGHPCFPESPEEQVRKISVIQAAIEAPPPPVSTEQQPEVTVRVDATLSECQTVLQVLVVAVAALHFAPALSALYTPLAIHILDEGRRGEERIAAT